MVFIEIDICMSISVVLFGLWVCYEVFCRKVKDIIYVGTFTRKDGRIDGKGKGIYVMETNWKNGIMYSLSVANENISSPAYIVTSPDKKHLYSVCREENDSYLYSFLILPNHHLKFVNSVSTGYRSLCHICLCEENDLIFTTNYIGGCLTMFQTEDGKIEKLDQIKMEGGGGPHPKQNSSKLHSSTLSRCNRTLFVADLGSDKIWIFNIQNRKLEQIGEFCCRPGSGPRMILRHPILNDILLCVNQLDCTLSLFQINDDNQDNITLSELDFLSTLPSTEENNNNKNITSSDLQIHPNGRYIYTSNRDDYNSITVFELLSEKKLKKIEDVSSRGIIPRGILVTENNHCLVANQDSDSIIIFSIDPSSGKLKFINQIKSIKTPVCLTIL